MTPKGHFSRFHFFCALQRKDSTALVTGACRPRGGAHSLKQPPESMPPGGGSGGRVSAALVGPTLPAPGVLCAPHFSTNSPPSHQISPQHAS